MHLPPVSLFQHLLQARGFLIAIIVSLIRHQRYIILETGSVVRRYTERRMLDTVLHDSLHINLIQDCHGICVIKTRGRYFHRQIVFKFREESYEILHLERSFVWR